MENKPMSLFEKLKQEGKPVSEGDFGPVMVVKGVHKGRLGYYDDDAYTPKTAKAVVYFDGLPGVPTCEDILVPHGHLIQAESTPFLDLLEKQAPDLVAMAGIVTRREDFIDGK